MVIGALQSFQLSATPVDGWALGPSPKLTLNFWYRFASQSRRHAVQFRTSNSRARYAIASHASSVRFDNLCFMMRWLGVRSNASTMAM